MSRLGHDSEPVVLNSHFLGIQVHNHTFNRIRAKGIQRVHECVFSTSKQRLHGAHTLHFEQTLTWSDLYRETSLWSVVVTKTGFCKRGFCCFFCTDLEKGHSCLCHYQQSHYFKKVTINASFLWYYAAMHTSIRRLVVVAVVSLTELNYWVKSSCNNLLCHIAWFISKKNKHCILCRCGN